MRQTFRRGGKFFYKMTDTKSKKPYTRKMCQGCGKTAMMQTRASAQFCSYRCSQLGDNNSNWSDDPGYIAAHGRVYRERGKASRCVFGDHDGPYAWASLMGELGNVDDYAEMCYSCHCRFDGAQEKCFDFICAAGHSFEKDGYYSRIGPKGEVRQCKECAKDRARVRRK